MPQMPYFVTSDGLAASLANPDVHLTMQGILVGKAHPMTVRSFHKRGWIAPDQRRALRTDHNTLILSGAVDRVREVLLKNTPTPTPASDGNGHTNGKTVTYQLTEPQAPQFSPTVEKVKQAMQELKGEVSFATIAAHPTLEGMNPGTLRWAIQVLRRAGVCQSQKAAAA